MRTRALSALLLSMVVGTAALAQRPAPTPRRPAAPAADAGAAAPSDAAAPSADAASPNADAHSAAADAGPAANGAAGADASSFNLPMVQRGTGALAHYPVPEQLARNDVPVFAQVRTTAVLDHVTLFYRTPGARRFTERRMTTMGAEQHLAGGFGALIPCEDSFPPAVEYYVEAIDTSGAVIGGAGSSSTPLSVAIVTQRTQPVVPTLPGQPAPRNCGSLVTAVASSGARRDGGSGDAAEAEPQRGTADLGELCTRDLDCVSTRMRCGTNRRCVFR